MTYILKLGRHGFQELRGTGIDNVTVRRNRLILKDKRDVAVDVLQEQILLEVFRERLQSFGIVSTSVHRMNRVSIFRVRGVTTTQHHALHTFQAQALKRRLRIIVSLRHTRAIRHQDVDDFLPAASARQVQRSLILTIRFIDARNEPKEESDELTPTWHCIRTGS